MLHKQGVFNLYKRIGETPLERLSRLRESRPELAHEPMTYAGRLDPMAEGVLLALVGDERLRKDEYLRLDKEYEFEVLWGFETDTYDALGIAAFMSLPPPGIGRTAATLAASMNGEIDQAYPPYSSRTAGGKPLFAWAREGRADEAPAAAKRIWISGFAVTETRSVSAAELLASIEGRIGKVGGDFRQEESVSSWRAAFAQAGNGECAVSSARVTLSSGGYVRSLARDLGRAAGCGAIALSIRRRRVGPYLIADSEA